MSWWVWLLLAAFMGANILLYWISNSALEKSKELVRTHGSWSEGYATGYRHGSVGNMPESITVALADGWDEGYYRGVRDQEGEMEQADNPYRGDPLPPAQPGAGAPDVDTMDAIARMSGQPRSIRPSPLATWQPDEIE